MDKSSHISHRGVYPLDCFFAVCLIYVNFPFNTVYKSFIKTSLNVLFVPTGDGGTRDVL